MRCGLLAVFIFLATPHPAAAAQSCPKGQVFVNNELGCVDEAEVEQAKITCKEMGATDDFAGCLCKDGDNVRACGD